MAQPPSDPGAPDLSYENALEMLDGRLRALEEGNLSLEEALKAVDDARTYLKVCEAKLDEAKHKIEVRPEGAADALGALPPQGRLL